MRLVSCGLVEETLATNRSMSEERKRLLNTSLRTSICACKVSLSRKRKVALPRKSKSLAVSFNSKSFNSSLPPNFMRPISCFFKVERRHFIPISASSFPVIVTLSCNGKVLASASRSTVDLVWKVINGSSSKSSTFASAKTSVCAPLKWNIFRFRYEG